VKLEVCRPADVLSRVRVSSGWSRDRDHYLFLNLKLNDIDHGAQPHPLTRTMSAAHIKLALSLPPRLRTFFARYPPHEIRPPAMTAYQKETPNPFKSTKHPITGRYHDPKYSMRRQADLAKLAREHGVEELLPPSTKKSETRLERRVTLGLRVKGTGVGQKVKGHKHERHMIAKYVFLVAWWRVWEEVWERDANSSVKDGEEEEGHGGDAGSHQGMEKGRISL